MGFPAVMPLRRLFVCQESNYGGGGEEMLGCWKYIESNCMNETCIYRQIGFHNANSVTRSNLQKKDLPPQKCVETFCSINDTNPQCFQVTIQRLVRVFVRYDQKQGRC